MLHKQSSNFFDIVLAPHEACELNRKVRFCDIQRVEVWKISGKAFRGKLIHMLGAEQIAQAMLAQVGKPAVGGQAVMDRLANDGRNEDLAPMPNRPEPSSPIHFLPVVISIPLFNVAEVDRHANAQGFDRGPILVLKLSLNFEGGQGRFERTVEDNKMAVALASCLDHSAAMPLNPRSDDGIMFG